MKRPKIKNHTRGDGTSPTTKQRATLDESLPKYVSYLVFCSKVVITIQNVLLDRVSLSLKSRSYAAFQP